MRLLKAGIDNTFSLTERMGDDVPHYAILSHTWGSTEEEVSFQDIIDRTGRDKPGYRKLEFCAKQAKNDGLDWFWVDTCCIDKSSSAELAEAINSMFKWYQQATKCYALLSDVSNFVDLELDSNAQPRDDVLFGESRWFRRGWTLQELLAPSCVVFFDRDGRRLGDKKSMAETIHKVTKINIDVLCGASLFEVSVAKRFSWATGRATTREEDKAYSLFGIFDVSLPSIYGEGAIRAMKRLREEINKNDNGIQQARPSRPSSNPHAPQRRSPRKRSKSAVRCYKCDKPGHYAFDRHCKKCGGFGHDYSDLHCYQCSGFGHYATDDHCFKCGKFGHYADDPHCYSCDHFGHFSNQCLRS